MRDFPHIAEIDLPGNGLRGRLMDMHEWHLELALQSNKGCGGNNVVRWWFADPANADAFAAKLVHDV